MEIINLVFFLIAFFGILVFVLYNKYRVRQLIKYSGIFLENGSISRKKFQTLFQSYTSFLSYSTWFPDANSYPAIYKDENFASFYKQSKAIMLVAGLCILIGFAGGVLADSFK